MKHPSVTLFLPVHIGDEEVDALSLELDRHTIGIWMDRMEAVKTRRLTDTDLESETFRANVQAWWYLPIEGKGLIDLCTGEEITDDCDSFFESPSTMFALPTEPLKQAVKDYKGEADPVLKPNSQYVVVGGEEIYFKGFYDNDDAPEIRVISLSCYPDQLQQLLVHLG